MSDRAISFKEVDRGKSLMHHYLRYDNSRAKEKLEDRYPRTLFRTNYGPQRYPNPDGFGAIRKSESIRQALYRQ